MGCTQQKVSSPARNRSNESISNGQSDTMQTNQVIVIQQLNQKQLQQKINQGRYSILQRVILRKDICKIQNQKRSEQQHYDQEVKKSRKFTFRKTLCDQLQWLQLIK
ncbi:unnamed protein product (macronuclear) [Paramecium tetraurelia]|uniref:Uncharacterized protein n=1 Tax=Paramecium tetraurelia TaxID=5888 RepID=A0CXC8_PARTE|nr:uncharacterized protein GSPATT00011077001 [Paramecium tetraurelia]CAK75445.1 unnamed protein product [Paramecium tetraurelia]|eukprot:XP_001442842.1 hypothetical protein (macronuclear) [Paramecium tetraurelia strain d4-2]